MILEWSDLLDCARKRKATIATAESCTGGLIASHITDVPGSSEVFKGGFVVYSNELKKEILFVSSKTLKEFGAVSRECARQMVIGLEKSLGSELSLAVTGIAGPGGGTIEKPVGTVFIGVKRRGMDPEIEGFHLKNLSRSEFKEKVSRLALGMMLGHLEC